MKKLIVMTGFFFFCAAYLCPQSLVELAKKEKERRAKLSEYPSIVITNADLKKIKKRSALKVSPSPSVQKTRINNPARRINSEGPKVIVSDNDYQIDQREFERSSQKYAARVLETTQHVLNAMSSLFKPDGRHAEIEYFGFLDLELEAENQDGPDIAVYAKRPQTGFLPSTSNYGLFAMDQEGEWTYIGTGGGIQSPETFELGEIPKTNKIRIVFKDYTYPNTVRIGEVQQGEYKMNIDAVESLHD
ncbi:MAG: hypothetical protein GF421_11710 [Candidatus Aminicenantes bacterium]|nr:hypothetical protein [Candidatus Aminicenantes bacterium]